ncbi:MAG: hypothetical protein AB1486_07355 [Planctomycetota bacterium]
MVRILMTICLTLIIVSPVVAQMDPEALQMQRLIVKIQKQMRAIDGGLQAGRDPQAASKVLEQNIKDIDDLLRALEGMQSQVINDLDELVKKAKYCQGRSQQSSSSDSQQQQSGEQARREKSSDPQELQRQESPAESREKPQDGREDSQPPQREETTDLPPSAEKGVFERADVSERWGILPPKEKEDLINADVSKLPERYRRWLDAYYRRVNEKRR